MSLLSWMVEEERARIRTAQQEGKYKGRKIKYYAEAKGKDKIIYDEIVKELRAGTSVMDIHRKTDIDKKYNL